MGERLVANRWLKLSRWTACALLLVHTSPVPAESGGQRASGGFVEKAGSPALRPRLSRAQIESFLPPNGAKGPFVFPPPYNTRGVRLTNATDCQNAQDCVEDVGYSYWRNINNHVGSSTMLIVLGLDRNRGGGGPTLFAYDKNTEAVQNLGALFDPASPYSFATGEGWYFSGTLPHALYTFLPGGTELRRFDVLTRQFEPVAALDLNLCPRPGVCPSNAAFIFQPHSSDDDLVHAATVQDGAFRRLGCVAHQSAANRFMFFPASAGYTLDECNLDKSGRWLIILESRPDGRLDNRIVDLLTGNIVTIRDEQGALGHLDTGFGYAIGADDFSPLPNATILLKFPVASAERPVGPVVHYNKRWDLVAANHVTHGNAAPGIGAEWQFACGSHASRVADMADEIICFPLNAQKHPDGSLDVMVVAPVMTDLDAAGGGDVDGDDYEQLPKGNLDVTGRYFIWTTNMAGDRLDAFIVKVPQFAPVPAGGSGTTGIIDRGIGRVDLNGDGLGDVFGYDPATGAWRMDTGNGRGAQARALVPAASGTWSPGWTIRPADFNGDGLTDFFLYNPTTGQWVKAISNGAFGFSYAAGTWSPGWTVGVLELNGDGRSDVFLYSPATGQWFRCTSLGDGTGEFGYVTGTWSPGWQVHLLDLNPDGLTDLFLYNPASGQWFRAANNGVNEFVYQTGTWSAGWSITPGDLNGDGLEDLFLYAPGSGAWFSVLNTGAGFAYHTESWSAGWSVGTADLNGDGRTDVFLYNPVTGAWFECFSNGGGGFTYAAGAWDPGWSFALAEFDGDGRADLLLYNPASGVWVQATNAGPGAFRYASGIWAPGLRVVAAGGP